MDPLQRAKELGIDNAESLTPKQLEKAIAAAEKAAAKLAKLQARATELGMDHEGVSAADLEAAIAEEEQAIADQEKRELAQLVNEKKVDILMAYLGLNSETIEMLTPEDLEKFLADRDLAIASQLNVADATVVELEGKTDKTFTFAASKKEYQFTKSAPAAFRFAGVVKTQAEWIEDKDAMEIMVSGNLSYLKPVKN